MAIFHIVIVLMVFLLWKMVKTCYFLPLQTYLKLRKNGIGGPKPCFPLGNLGHMKKLLLLTKSSSSSSYSSSPSTTELVVSHDIHSSSLPYFAQWKKLHGKVYVYWMGVEPFLYVADPEFLKQMSTNVVAKNWGKPNVFKSDRTPMFGEYGLNMIESNTWLRHRHIITPAFSPSNLKGMTNSMMESTKKMVEKWTNSIVESSSNRIEIDIEREVTMLAGEIIAKTNFGVNSETGNILFDKLRAMQISLFKHTRYVGVPFGQFLSLKQTLEARKLGQEIDQLLLAIINARRKVIGLEPDQHDLLGLLLKGGERIDGQFVRNLSSRELVDECKTFFFGGHETVALAMTWTLMLLALHPKWQDELRQEIIQVIGDKDHLDFTMLAQLKKMGWVMNEVLRLYPSSPNAQRQARSDIKVGEVVIPNGTNIWIDVVGMHHDRSLWGDDVHEFKPHRFDGNLYGGCKHKMGYLPFGFGGRMCIGRNYAIMEYKIVMSTILQNFSFSLSPSYTHSPTYFFSFRPTHGVPLIVKPL